MFKYYHIGSPVNENGKFVNKFYTVCLISVVVEYFQWKFLKKKSFLIHSTMLQIYMVQGLASTLKYTVLTCKNYMYM